MEDPAPEFDVVFLGELISEEPDFQLPCEDDCQLAYRTVTFRVLRSWKGVTGTEITVETEAGGSFAGCGYWSSIGNRDLIFANSTNNGNLRIPPCSWFREYYTGEYIAELEQLGVDEITLTEGPDQTFPSIPSGPQACGPMTGIIALLGCAGLARFVQRRKSRGINVDSPCVTLTMGGNKE